MISIENKNFRPARRAPHFQIGSGASRYK